MHVSAKAPAQASHCEGSSCGPVWACKYGAQAVGQLDFASMALTAVTTCAKMGRMCMVVVVDLTPEAVQERLTSTLYAPDLKQ